jgi:hypothetical protein
MKFIENNLLVLSLIIVFYILCFILHYKQDKIELKNIYNQTIKKVPIGYSWLSLVFLFLVPLFRKDWEWFFTYFLVTIFTLGIAIPIIAYMYNKIYIYNLIKTGYIASNQKSGELLFSKILK